MKTSELRNKPNDELIAVLCLLHNKDYKESKTDISKICNELQRRGIIEDSKTLYMMLA
jgi:hypothetical protein